MILAVGDLHFHTNTLHIIPSLTREIIRVIHEHHITDVVLLGDTLDRFESINMIAWHRSVQFMETILNHISGKLYVIIGNHDRINNNEGQTDLSPYYTMKQWARVHIIDKVQIIDNMLFVPYLPKNKFNDVIAKIDLTNVVIGFGHQEFQGCSMGAIVSDSTDVWDYDIPFISGHIHIKQKLGHVWYPGTPYQQSYSDHHVRYVLITDKHNITEVPLTNMIVRQLIKFDYNLKQDIVKQVKAKLQHNIDLKVEILCPGSLIKSIKKETWYKELKTINKNTYLLRSPENISPVVQKDIPQLKNFDQLVLDNLQNNLEAIQLFKDMIQK